MFTCLLLSNSCTKELQGFHKLIPSYYKKDIHRICIHLQSLLDYCAGSLLTKRRSVDALFTSDTSNAVLIYFTILL